MKHILSLALGALMVLCGASNAKAQYFSMVNQATDMLTTAIMGGFAYRGLVEAGFNRGIGTNQPSFLEFSTTQGFQFKEWFFMGAGAGVDVLFSNSDKQYAGIMPSEGLKKNACMVPLFTEVRFLIGSPSQVSFFIGTKIGASFLIGQDYVPVGDGYLNRSECFYFKPAIGLRIPVDRNNSKHALNVGASYTLVNTDYWTGNTNSITLNSLGITVGYEW